MRLTVVRTALNPRNIEYLYTPSYKIQAVMFASVFGFGWPIGRYLEEQDQNRMTRFRDKSALFGKEKGPDDEPSWGAKEYYWKFGKWERKWWY
jgi:hypothetical protein